VGLQGARRQLRLDERDLERTPIDAHSAQEPAIAQYNDLI
jgi:hypothetical protein